MEFAHYLAMTPEEMTTAALPEKGAWMACHFSREGRGLSNLPENCPPGWLWILNDAYPFADHDTEQIARELQEGIESNPCPGLLLDLQRPKTKGTADLVKLLRDTLPCPVAAPPDYALAGQPVFLPPVPTDCIPEEYITPWKGRDIWLETAMNCEMITINAHGAKKTSIPGFLNSNVGLSDSRLHCHYTMRETDNAVECTLWRTKDDLRALLEDAQRLGVSVGIGLYQELGDFFP